MGRSAKGTAFERQLAVAFSRWWTDGERDDVFWRTGGSGGRARTRGRRGKETVNQHGDLAATDAVGSPLIKLVAIEVKRGYSRHTIADLLDKSVGAAQQVYEEWFEKCLECQQQAGAFSWLLIVKRDRRDALVFMPSELGVVLRWGSNEKYLDLVTAMFRLVEIGDVWCMRLSDWFAWASPKCICKWQEWEGGN